MLVEGGREEEEVRERRKEKGRKERKVAPNTDGWIDGWTGGQEGLRADLYRLNIGLKVFCARPSSFFSFLSFIFFMDSECVRDFFFFLT